MLSSPVGFRRSLGHRYDAADLHRAPQKQFAEIATRLELARSRFHDARHAFASSTLKNGVPIEEVSTLLGHSSPTLTLTTYAHVMEGMGRGAVNGLAGSLLK